MVGTLNRIPLVEVGLSKALVGLMFALPYLESPVRVRLGYRSDGFPLWGKRAYRGWSLGRCWAASVSFSRRCLRCVFGPAIGR